MSIRTPLANVRGLGSAKSGTHHWWMQRLTALAMIPLAAWLVNSLMHMMLGDVEMIKLWMDSPIRAFLLAAFLGAASYHGKLGMQVVIEDYVHGHCSKTTLLIANAFFFIALFAVAIMAILKLHLHLN